MEMIRKLLGWLCHSYDEGYEDGYRQAERDFEAKQQIRIEFGRKHQ